MIVLYLFVFTLVLVVCSMCRSCVANIDNISIRRDGVVFNSYHKHRIYIANANIMQVGTTCYLRQGKTLITINNIDHLYLRDHYLYFQAKGRVEIKVDLSKIGKYFNIYIKSDKLDFDKLQHRAQLSLINHLFNIADSKELREYMLLIRRVLNIKLDKDEVTIQCNKYNIEYTLYYKVHNVIKKINIRST